MILRYPVFQIFALRRFQPEAAEEILRQGRREGQFISIERDLLESLLKKKFDPPIPSAPMPFPKPDISQREPICAACDWNVDWICEHPGCKTCSGRQRMAGNLKSVILTESFRCPLNKF